MLPTMLSSILGCFRLIERVIRKTRTISCINLPVAVMQIFWYLYKLVVFLADLVDTMPFSSTFINLGLGPEVKISLDILQTTVLIRSV